MGDVQALPHNIAFTPTPAPDRMTAAELRAVLHFLTERLDQIAVDKLLIHEGLTTAANQPAAPAPTGETTALDVSSLLMSYDVHGPRKVIGLAK